MGRQDSVRFLVCQGDQSLDRQGVSNVYVSSSSSFPRAAVVYGCESRGLGRSYGISDGIRILAPRIKIITYQCSGDESKLACSSGICFSHPRTFCATRDRQHNSVGSYQQTGGEGGTLVHTVQSSGRDCIMVCKEQNTHQSETLARKTQCFGRLSVQEREHCSDRMVTESASDKPDISHYA